MDHVPLKTCSYDCIYCQLGRTTKNTIELEEYVPAKGVLEELDAKLKEAPRPDCIGIAGYGESTLHARLGGIIAGVKALTDFPVAVLTNGSLLWKPEARAGIGPAPQSAAGPKRHRGLRYRRGEDPRTGLMKSQLRLHING